MRRARRAHRATGFRAPRSHRSLRRSDRRRRASRPSARRVPFPRVRAPPKRRRPAARRAPRSSRLGRRRGRRSLHAPARLPADAFVGDHGFAVRPRLEHFGDETEPVARDGDRRRAGKQRRAIAFLAPVKRHDVGADSRLQPAPASRPIASQEPSRYFVARRTRSNRPASPERRRCPPDDPHAVARHRDRTAARRTTPPPRCCATPRAVRRFGDGQQLRRRPRRRAAAAARRCPRRQRARRRRRRSRVDEQECVVAVGRIAHVTTVPASASVVDQHAFPAFEAGVAAPRGEHRFFVRHAIGRGDAKPVDRKRLGHIRPGAIVALIRGFGARGRLIASTAIPSTRDRSRTQTQRSGRSRRSRPKNGATSATRRRPTLSRGGDARRRRVRRGAAALFEQPACEAVLF